MASPGQLDRYESCRRNQSVTVTVVTFNCFLYLLQALHYWARFFILTGLNRAVLYLAILFYQPGKQLRILFRARFNPVKPDFQPVNNCGSSGAGWGFSQSCTMFLLFNSPAAGWPGSVSAIRTSLPRQSPSTCKPLLLIGYI